MKVTFWGTRGSIAAPGPDTARYGGNTSCVEVRAEGHVLIFDAGTGIRALGQALTQEFAERPLTVHLFISHTHWDHIQGFPFFVPIFARSATIHVYGAPGQGRSLEKVLRGQMESDYFPVGLGDLAATIDVHEFRAADFDIGDVTIAATYLNHPGMNLAYRVSHGGRRLVYATDHEPYASTLDHLGGRGDEGRVFGERLDGALVDFAREADLLIGDAQYTDDEYVARIGWGHSPLSAAVTLAVAARVKALALFHHDPMHGDDVVLRMERLACEMIAARGAAVRCFAAAEGQSLTLGGRPARGALLALATPRGGVTGRRGTRGRDDGDRLAPACGGGSSLRRESDETRSASRAGARRGAWARAWRSARGRGTASPRLRDGDRS